MGKLSKPTIITMSIENHSDGESAMYAKDLNLSGLFLQPLNLCLSLYPSLGSMLPLALDA